MEALEEFSGLIIFGVIIFIVILSQYIKSVPPNTILIIDRNTHYLKTKRRGLYFFNPKTDKITTKISTSPVTENVINTYKTHDDCYYRLQYSVVYNSTDIEMTISSLQDSKRSVYDIINCALEATVASLSRNDMNYKVDINEVAFKQLEYMLEPFYIDVTGFKLISRNERGAQVGAEELFRKHVSRGDNPVGYD